MALAAKFTTVALCVAQILSVTHLQSSRQEESENVTQPWAPLTVERCETAFAASSFSHPDVAIEMTGYCDQLATVPLATSPDSEVISTYASTFELPMDEAAYQWQHEQRAGSLVGQVRLLAGERLSGGWVTHEPTLGVHVRLTEGPEITEIKDLLARNQYAHTVEYNGILPRDELVALGIDNYARWTSAHPSIVKISPDEFTETLHILVRGSAEQAQLIATSIEAETSSRGVSVSFDASPDAWISSDNRGGRYIANGCTAGITAKTPGGTLLMTTAGHCSNSVESYQWSNGTVIPLAYRSESMSSTTDFQTYDRVAGQEAFKPEYYPGVIGAGFERPILGQAYRIDQLNTMACNYGRVTVASCSTVYSINEYWSGVDTSGMSGSHCANTTCGTVWVGTRYARAGGDSGGPVTNGWAIAYGLHTGGGGTGSTRFGFYMAIGYLNHNGLNVATT